MTTSNNDAKAQVQAFLEVLKEQHDLDEQKIAKIVAVAQKNGKTYITIAWVMGVLMALAAFLAERQLTAIEKQLEAVSIKQGDVRERLKALEQMVADHIKAKL